MSETPDSVMSPSLQASTSTGVVAVVDPVSTGACLAYHLANKGHRLVRVWSDMCPPTVRAHTKAGTEVDWLATYEYQPGHAYTLACELAKNHGNGMTVMVGCETGVLAADVLASALGSRGNGKDLSELRRNKFLQIEAVRSAGLGAPFQAQVQSAEEVEEWLTRQEFAEPFKAVVKPVDGAGSDGVTICDSRDDVRRAFAGLEGTKNVLGLTNYNVLQCTT